MSRKPNIIFILTDDQGYGDMGWGGNPIVRTPNIDAFASESTRLTNFHVGPTCAPTRSGLMTGHYANSTGVWHTIGGRSLLRKDEWTLASALKENGYHTGIFGKWHLGDTSPYRPHERGFDTAVVHGGGGISQTSDWWGNDYFDDTYFVNGVPNKYEGYCTDVFFEEAKNFIEGNKEEAFFCYIALNAPHGPFNVEDRYADTYRSLVDDQRARFYGMIENIDENVGGLRTWLKEKDLEQNTILVFMTDNGSGGGVTVDDNEFVISGWNNGMRGKKGSPYDGGHRVPFFIRWPEGGIKENVDLNHLTANIDFMPTLLDLCDIHIPDNKSFHGISLKSLLLGQEDEWPDRAIVTDSQRLTQPVKWRKSAVCTQKWRLINGEELYDIDKDREQRDNVASQHPEIIEELREAYEEWWKLVSPKFNESISHVIGPLPSYITGHDLVTPSAINAWNQQLIREGYLAAGHYEIYVKESAHYRIRLYRWPLEQNRPITAGIEGDDIEFCKEYIDEKDWPLYTGGLALDIGHATIGIQEQHLQAEVNQEDVYIEFNVDLEEGETLLKPLFVSKSEDYVVSPYFVHIEQVNQVKEDISLTQEEKEWVLRTRDKIVKKMSWVSEKSKNKIPYTTVNGEHTDRRDNPSGNDADGISWWTNGFWAGMMWQMYHETKEDKYADIAKMSEQWLDQCFLDYEGLHHDVGFMWLPSAVTNYKITGNPYSKTRGMHAANLLAGRFNLNGRFIRAWNGLKTDETDTRGWAIIDCMFNIPILYWASEESGDPRFKHIAMAHADTVIKNFIRPDGSSEHIVEFDPNTGEKCKVYRGQGYAVGSSWTRGQTWALYGFMMSYNHTKEQRYLDTAKRIAHYFIANIPESGLIPVDFRQPQECEREDSTAAAIGACGLLELAKSVPELEQNLYKEAAMKMLVALEEKRVDWSENEDSLVQKCNNAYHNYKENHVSIIYGDYYFIEAVLKLKGDDLYIW